MSDRGSGYMINAGDRVMIRKGEDTFFAKLIEINMNGTEDTIETETGEIMTVERTEIYPANIQEIYSFKAMKAELNKGICEVTFTKKNGDERVMPCTLVFDSIPEAHQPKGTGSTHQSQETIAVWCMDKEAWRSFRVDSVTKFERLTGIGKGEKTTINLDGIFK